MKFTEMTMKQLVEAYHEFNPKIGPTFKFANLAKGVKQISQAYNDLMAKADKTEAEQALLVKYSQNDDQQEQAAQAEGDAQQAEAQPTEEQQEQPITEEQAADQGEDQQPPAEAEAKGDLPLTKAGTPFKTKEEIKAAISAGTKDSWNNVSIRAARMKRNYCTVDGNIFQSVIKAAAQYGWEKLAIQLRKLVKIYGNVKLIDGDKSYHIILLGATGKDIGSAQRECVEFKLAEVNKLARCTMIQQLTDEQADEVWKECEARAAARAATEQKRAAKKAEKATQEQAKAEAQNDAQGEGSQPPAGDEAQAEVVENAAEAQAEVVENAAEAQA